MWEGSTATGLLTLDTEKEPTNLGSTHQVLDSTRWVVDRTPKKNLAPTGDEEGQMMPAGEVHRLSLQGRGGAQVSSGCSRPLICQWFQCRTVADWCLVDNVSRRLDSAAEIHSAALNFDI